MDNLWLWVILAGLANYKASRMITQPEETGPFDIFERFRDWIGIKTWIGRGFHCFICTSFWGALIATLLIGIGLPINLFIIVWGAIAGFSLVLWSKVG